MNGRDDGYGDGKTLLQVALLRLLTQPPIWWNWLLADIPMNATAMTITSARTTSAPTTAATTIAIVRVDESSER